MFKKNPVAYTPHCFSRLASVLWAGVLLAASVSPAFAQTGSIEAAPQTVKPESKQRELEERWLWTVLGGSLVLLLGTVYFVSGQRRTNRRLAEVNRQLQKSQHRLQATLNAIPDMMFEVDAEGRYYDLSPPLNQDLAAQAATLIGKKVTDVLPPRPAAVCMAALAEAQAGGSSFGKQFWLTLLGGKTWFELSVARKQPGFGQGTRFVVLCRDISERKQMEASLQASEQQFRALAENSPDNIALYDLQCRTLYLNPSLEKTIGQQTASAAGKTPEENLPGVPSVEEYQRTLEAVIASGQPQETESTFEDPVLGLRYHNMRFMAVRGLRGEIVGALAIGRDITASKQSQLELVRHRDHLEELVKERTAELAARERNFRSLTENLPDNVARWDTQGRYLYLNANQAQTLGVEVGDLVGTPLFAKHDGIKAAIAQVVATGQAIALVRQPVLIDGETQIHEVNLAPEYDAEGRVVSVVGLGRDMTEMYRMQDALAARERDFRSLTENLPDNIARWDVEGRYLYINPAHERTLGLSISEVIGKPILESHVQVSAAIRQVVATGQAVKSVRQLAPVNGEIQIHEVSLVPERDDAGRIVSVLGMGRNMTEFYRMQDAIAAREHELRSLADSSPGMMGSYYLKPDGTICMPYVSPNIEDLFGLHPEDLAQDVSALTALNHPDDAQRVLDTIAESARSMTTWHCEYRIQHPTKGERWMESNTNPQPHPDGGIIWYGYVHDITTRKQAEAALQTSELLARSRSNLLRAILESSPEIIVFALDTGYRYQAFNSGHRETMRAIWGKEIEIGMNMLDVIGLPSDRATAKRGFDRALSGESFTEENMYGDETLKREYWQSFYSPIRSESGEVTGLTCFVLNNTERKQLESELRASRNFLDSVIDSVSDPIFVKDRQHRWTLLNDAFCNFIGHPRAALLDKSDYDFFPKEQADVFWEKDELVFKSGKVNLNEERFTSADGVQHFIQTKKTPFVSGDGREMLVGVIRDITERQHLESAREAALDEAERLAKTRSEFIAQMSHELRTPLNGILGYAQILGRDASLNDRQLTSVEVIRSSGEHLLALIEDILDLARIESGRLQLNISDIALQPFLQIVTGIIEVKARQKKNIGFVCETPSDLPQVVRGDEKRLRQVLLNLLANAIKFTEQGRVVFGIHRVTSSRLAFLISDTGVGIASDDRELIFHAFEQVGDVRHRIGGTGLGLAISRQLVLLMGGDITLDSVPGTGSTFRFELELPESSGEALQSGDALSLPAAETRQAPDQLVIPPAADMRELHHLALQGNMSDIAAFAQRIARENSACQPFADHLLNLTLGFQSRAILTLVERYLA
jgi:PAS domain S-box-containing protein